MLRASNSLVASKLLAPKRWGRSIRKNHGHFFHRFCRHAHGSSIPCGETTYGTLLRRDEADTVEKRGCHSP